jgi:bacteriorhodopsin
MPLADIQFWSLIAMLCGVGLVTYLLNRSGRKWGWYFLAALFFLIVGSFVVLRAFNFATGDDLRR